MSNVVSEALGEDLGLISVGYTYVVHLMFHRLHAQFLTLAALAGSAAVEAYDQQVGEKAKRYEKHIQTNVN